MLCREDVILAYRNLLGREPESEETIEAHIASCTSIELLDSIIKGSTEYTSNLSRQRFRSTPDNLKRYLPQPEIEVELLIQDLSGQYGMYLAGLGSEERLASIVIGRPTGRFGNNFFQIGNALVVAAGLGVTELFVPEMQSISYVQETSWHGVRLLRKSNEPPSDALIGDFYAPFGFETFFSSLADRFVSSACAHINRSFYSHLITPANKKMRRLGVHFRGGDVFSNLTGVHGYYVQPPASYYIYAIEHALKAGEVDEIVLISEDRVNPCLTLVEQHFSSDTRLVKVELRSIELDLKALTDCNYIVGSYSTFVEVACILSQTLQTAYFFRSSSSQDMYKPFLQSRVADILKYDGKAVYVVEDGSVSYMAPRTWANTEAQLWQMRSFPKSNLRLFRS